VHSHQLLHQATTRSAQHGWHLSCVPAALLLQRCSMQLAGRPGMRPCSLLLQAWQLLDDGALQQQQQQQQ
jgi:hypothetical protein